MGRKKSDDEGMFVDYEMVHDGLGITHFLSPKKCENCDD